MGVGWLNLSSVYFGVWICWESKWEKTCAPEHQKDDFDFGNIFDHFGAYFPLEKLGIEKSD